MKKESYYQKKIRELKEEKQTLYSEIFHLIDGDAESIHIKYKYKIMRDIENAIFYGENITSIPSDN